MLFSTCLHSTLLSHPNDLGIRRTGACYLAAGVAREACFHFFGFSNDISLFIISASLSTVLVSPISFFPRSLQDYAKLVTPKDGCVIKPQQNNNNIFAYTKKLQTSKYIRLGKCTYIIR